MKWRHWVRPEILLLVGAVQANLPYLLWRLGYPISRPGKFPITYRPLYLWILAYFAFCLGCFHVSFCLCRKSRHPARLVPFRVVAGVYWPCMFVVVVLVLVQVVLACRLYGVLPILAFFSGYDIGTMNTAQDASGFGQLGLLRITVFALNALIIVGFVTDIRLKGSNTRKLWGAILVAAFASVFGGKTQGVFLLGCALFTGLALVGANPLSVLLSRSFQLSRMSRRRTILVMVVLFFVLALFHASVHYVRSPVQKGFRIGYAFTSVGNYLSYPLMNMEKQVAVAGLSGGRSDWRGLLVGLFPHKLRRSFMADQSLPENPRVEPTSPSGFLSLPHWCLGLGWMLVFMFVIGVICQCLYVQSRRSLFCLLAYSQIAWTLVAAHSYNHFLTLIFIPVPIMVFFVLSILIKTRPVGLRSACTPGQDLMTC